MEIRRHGIYGRHRGDNIESTKQARRADIERSRCLTASSDTNRNHITVYVSAKRESKKRQASGRKQKTLRQPRVCAR